MDASQRKENSTLIAIAEAEEALKESNGISQNSWSPAYEELVRASVSEPYYPLVLGIPELLKFGKEIERIVLDLDPRLLADPENAELEDSDLEAIKETYTMMPTEVRKVLLKGLNGGIMHEEAMKIAAVLRENGVQSPGLIAAWFVLLGAVI